jgi:hypothetical protein
MDNFSTPNYSGPTTTANSAAEGRLKVGVTQAKKKIIKKHLKKNG